jgi:hypothetical protein
MGPVVKDPYRVSILELEELKRNLTDLLEVGFIRPSRFPLF